MEERKIRVEIVLAFPKRQELVEVRVRETSSIRDAIDAANIFAAFDEVSPAVKNLEYGVGIFGKEIKDVDNYVLQDGDRIEIYRPLLLDPQQARVKRAKEFPLKKGE